MVRADYTVYTWVKLPERANMDSILRIEYKRSFKLAI